MRNMKFISIFAACGFVLSFVFSLFSHSSFLMILLRAFVSSLCFVALGFLVSFIFKKFLMDSNNLGFESEEMSDVSSKAKTEDKDVNREVDIVVEDEELPESDSDNHFVVGNNTQMLKKTDVGEEKNRNQIDGRSVNQEFVPMKGFENVSQPSNHVNTSLGSGDIASQGFNQFDDTSSAQTVSDDELDTLPDMENLELSENEEVVGDDSSYSAPEFKPSASTYKKSNNSGPDIKDAALIAKAISTALSEEN